MLRRLAPRAGGQLGGQPRGNAVPLAAPPEACEVDATPTVGGRFGRLPEFVERLGEIEDERARRVEAVRRAIADGSYPLDERGEIGVSRALDAILGSAPEASPGGDVDEA